jgi:protein-S-isoprenylcysteine O-methyltransferase Ste14
MCGGGFLMLLGVPVALGSWWGVLVFIAIIPAVMWRLLDEEKFLARNLPGYAEYQDRVRFRLLPLVW